jgi:very-short-patch-repair endonuclease
MDPKLVKRRREARFRSLVRRQHGAVARRQLIAIGFSNEEIRVRRARGELIPIHRGVMILAGVPRTRATIEAAAWLACGEDSVVSGRSAACRRGLLPYPPGETVVEVTVTRSGASRQGIRVHRSRRLDPDERQLLDGVPTTSIDRTLLDLGARATDRELERALAAALDRRATSRARLQRYLERRRRWHGVARLRALIDSAEPPRHTRSPPEEQLLGLIRSSDLPDPLTNHPIGSYELDAYWPEAKLAVEYDSRRHHLGEAPFEHDRLRDGWLAAEHGILVIRVTGRQLRDPTALIDRLQRAYAWRCERRRP